MQIAIQRLTASEYGSPENIKEAFAHELDGSDYGTGQFEAVARTARNACQALGRLCEVLHKRGLIDRDDLARVLDVSGVAVIPEPEPENLTYW